MLDKVYQLLAIVISLPVEKLVCPFKKEISQQVNTGSATEGGSGLPQVITMNDGPDFVSSARDEWAYHRKVKSNFYPAWGTDNAYAGSFTGRRLRMNA